MSKASSWTSVFGTKMISRFFPVFIKVCVLFFVVFLVYYLVYLFLLSDLDITGTDYVVYLTGVRIVQSGNREFLYDASVQSSFQQEVVAPFSFFRLLPFLSLPYVLTFYLPYSTFSLFLGYRLFLVFNLAMVGIFLWLSKRIFPGISRYLFWFLVPFSSFAVLHALLLGQISLVMLVFFLVFYAFFRKGKSFLAGFVFGLFVLIKLQYLVGLPFFLLLSKQRLKFFSGFFVSGLVVTLVSVWFSSVEALFSYPKFLLGSSSLYGGQVSNMTSFFSALRVLAEVANVYGWLSVVLHWIVYAVVFLLFLQKYAALSFKRSFVAATIFMLVFSVYAFDHDLVILLVPVFVLLDAVSKIRDRVLSVGFIVAVVFLVLPLLFLLKIPLTISWILLGFGLWLLVSSVGFSEPFVEAMLFAKNKLFK